MILASTRGCIDLGRVGQGTWPVTASYHRYLQTHRTQQASEFSRLLLSVTL